MAYSFHRALVVACMATFSLSTTGCQKNLGAGGARGGEPVAPVERPKGALDLTEANEYVLALVNRDRAENGLSPVEWDEDAAKAAQRHVEDMVRHGYTGHWGTDGTVPEQRYTEAGGEHLSTENAAGLFDAQQREVDPDPTFDPVELEKIQATFMAEVPPADGHKRNILKKWHNKLGIGIAKPVGISQPSLVQEFVDAYGEYDDLPRTARVGQSIRVSGEVHPPVRFGGVGIARIDAARPIPVEDLLKKSSYPIPEPYVLFSPKGFKTPKPVEVEGNHFGIDVDLSDRARPGRYEISIWGSYPDSEKNELVMISLRTITVR